MNSSFDPIEYINKPRWKDVNLGLERITLFLELLGNPQNEILYIHVAGTNGKGSVCAYMDSIFRSAGYKVGLFTSPYIDHFEERIKVNGEEIDASSLKRLTLILREAANIVEEKLGEHPTEFELMFALAATYFKDVDCDVVVCEVGLGGRLDATNVIEPVLSVITSISLDHCDYLGNTLKKIASEKAGIIKEHVPVVTCTQNADVMDVLKKKCKEKQCELYITDRYIDLGIQRKNMTRFFEYKDEKFETQLLGKYQVQNACIAIQAMDVLKNIFPLTSQELYSGIKDANWEARFEILRKDPLLIVDGSHNLDGVRVLIDSLKDIFLIEEDPKHLDDREFFSNSPLPEKSIVYVFGVLADKQYEDMINEALPYAKAWVTYTPNINRALSSFESKQVIEELTQNDSTIDVDYDLHYITAKDSAQDALLYALKKYPEDIIVAFGTLYSISELKSAYKKYKSIRP